MKVALYERFKAPLQVSEVKAPEAAPTGAVIEVAACGLCRSDWHGWQGHDAEITPPQVPGHEFAGTIVELGKNVTRFQVGQRVTVPFVCACGHCLPCASGNQQVCDHQFQPGFTAWGAFAERVAIPHADQNLVVLPESMTFETAAVLGCRFSTAFRAVFDQGQVQPGDWVAVYGCGGLGLSAVMLAAAAGARVIGIDISAEQLALAKSAGATMTISAQGKNNVAEEVVERTKGGVQVSLDALGSKETCINSVRSLKKRGKHIQVGLMLGEDKDTAIPLDRVIANELEILGSHGMQAHRFEQLFTLIETGDLHPEHLIHKRVTLSEGAQLLTKMDEFKHTGVMLINDFTK